MDTMSLERKRDELHLILNEALALTYKYAGTPLYSTYRLWAEHAELDLLEVERELQSILSMMTTDELRREQLHT
jgi:hypothetical protein